MKFETIEETAFELEAKINIENASMETKESAQILKKMGSQVKQYKEAFSALEANQKEAWDELSSKVEQTLTETLEQSAQKIKSTEKRLKLLNKTLEKRIAEARELEAARPAAPKKPGK